MKRILFQLCFLFITSLFSQYEYPSKENAEGALQKTLAVQLLDETDDYGKYANVTVKEIFNDNWQLTKIEFLSKDKIEALKEAKDDNYAYLTHKDELLKDMRTNHISSYPGSTTFGRSFAMGVNAPTESISYKRVAFSFAYYSNNLEIMGK